ncbi:uncharacterized protein LOC132952395 [Metopolophium dirhodum]|uniref:uncharacterized protein LOC132952395 n=1 Tax=Metopolophium dirhodum TaxID=44670 RepID=UPI002990150E|nr:uncharacterized protein LOC132952395 [Metopolophium dirhodum]
MLAGTRPAKSRPRQISLTSNPKLNSTKHNYNITYHTINRRVSTNYMLAELLKPYIAPLWTAHTVTLLTLHLQFHRHFQSSSCYHPGSDEHLDLQPAMAFYSPNRPAERLPTAERTRASYTDAGSVSVIVVLWKRLMSRLVHSPFPDPFGCCCRCCMPYSTPSSSRTSSCFVQSTEPQSAGNCCSALCRRSGPTRIPPQARWSPGGVLVRQPVTPQKILSSSLVCSMSVKDGNGHLTPAFILDGVVRIVRSLVVGRKVEVSKECIKHKKKIVIFLDK